MTEDTPPQRRTNRSVDRHSRRAFLTATAAATAGFAGCLDGGGSPTRPEAIETDDGADTRTRPQVSNPPEEVYLPSHRASMVRLSAVDAGEYTLVPHVSFPHRFWLVTGTDLEEVAPSEFGVHLMASVRDAETGRPLPVGAGAESVVRHDGEVIDRRAPWPMIAQPMGFHFGDNIPLPGPGTYTAEVTMNPIGARKTGAFADRFAARASATFEFEYTDEVRRQLVEGVEFLDADRWGTPGALEPMSHGHGDGSHGHGGAGMVPPASEYPGRDLGTPSIGDADFVARYLDAARLPPDGSGYLLVSARTPYNRYPLPDMALSVAGAREGELVQTLDDELGHHYGIGADLASGDALELVVETPPQVARHRGYETAFLEAGSARLEVPER